MNRKPISKRTTGFWLLAGLLIVAGVVRLGVAQQNRPLSDFKVSEYYTNSIQKKTETTAKQIRQLPGSLVELTNGLMVRTWQENGDVQMTMTAPQCFFDRAKHQAQSSGPLEARSGDGRFFIEGEGWFWRQDSSQLEISNKVHSILQQETNNPAGSNTVIYSQGFRFDLKARDAIYYGNVHVEDPKMKLACEFLNAKLPEPGHKLDHILVETNVVIDVEENGEKTHATGAAAVYTYSVTGTVSKTTNELMELSGNPRLDRPGGSMSADKISMDRISGRLRGDGNQHSVFKSQAAGGDTNAPVTETSIFSDQFDYDRGTGQAVYRGHVRVEDPRMTLACDTLTAPLPQGDARTNHFDHIVAEDHVVIDYGQGGDRTHGMGDRAVYTFNVVNGVTNEIVKLTGNPRIEKSSGLVVADEITADRATGRIEASGHQHSTLKARLGGSTNSIATAQSVEIASEKMEFETKTGLAIYGGGVLVTDPQMTLICARMTAHLPQGGGNTNHIDHIVAETNVVIDMMDEKAQKTHATGEKAVYDFSVAGSVTNEIVLLTGSPMVERIGQGVTTGDLIILDRTKGVIRSVGHSATVLWPRNMVQTNATPRTRKTSGKLKTPTP